VTATESATHVAAAATESPAHVAAAATESPAHVATATTTTTTATATTTTTTTTMPGGQGVRLYGHAECDGSEEDHDSACDRLLLDVLNEVHGSYLYEVHGSYSTVCRNAPDASILELC
jgi:hypothetical protein